MRGGLGFCLANALLLLGMAAHADPTLPDLRTLPSIGTTKPQTNLRWGMGRAQLHSLYPGLSPTSFSVGLYSVQGVAAYRGCTFTLRLDSGLNPGPDGRLQSARLQYLTGNLQTCSRGLESTLTLLYGPPQITKHPTGWPDGSGPPASVFMDWKSATTCIGLWWEDGEARWGPSLRLTLAEKGEGCGGYDDEVVRTERR
jgi:hypothetical protein